MNNPIEIRFRKWVAHRLARLARRIYPEEPEVMAFYMDRMTDFIISGKSNVRVSVVPDEEVQWPKPEELVEWKRP